MAENFITVGDGKIFLDKIEDGKLDELTFKQIEAMIANPAIEHARVMPDCHAGIGCVVGFTSKLSDKVVPSWIGGDIGCGILTYPLGKLSGEVLSEKELSKIDQRIRQAVPMGISNDFSVFERAVVSREQIDELCQQSRIDSEQMVELHKHRYPEIIPPTIPEYSYEWFHLKCKQIFINFDYVLRGLGSLGSNNHFIEINKSKDNVYYLTIHCGSRGFGGKICAHHQGRVTKQQVFDWADYHKEERKLKKLHKKDKALYDEKVRELTTRMHEAEKNPVNFLMGNKAFEYYYDFIFALNYAKLNRRIILQQILEVLKLSYDPSQIIESIHNYIDFTDFIIRKGAISAHKDQLCIVALNMRDGIRICRGRGEEDWNYSCAHGSGRTSSRKDAMSNLKMSRFEADMSGIYSSSVVRECLDESPQAYKDSEMVLGIIRQTVDIVEELKPILSIRAIN
jgi:tRNA-splicing ligase RtcB